MFWRRFLLHCVFVGSVFSLAANPVDVSAQVESLKVNEQESQVSVTFKQMNVPVDAVFNKVDIVAQFDPDSPDQAKAMILIETSSFDFGPGAEEYNEEVRAPDWFDSKQFPTAIFEGLEARVDAADKSKFEVIGKLTIKGVSQDVIAPFELKKQANNWVLEGQLPIKRLDFNIGEGDWKDTSIVENEVIVKFKIVTDKP